MYGKWFLITICSIKKKEIQKKIKTNLCKIERKKPNQIIEIQEKKVEIKFGLHSYAEK